MLKGGLPSQRDNVVFTPLAPSTPGGVQPPRSPHAYKSNFAKRMAELTLVAGEVNAWHPIVLTGQTQTLIARGEVPASLQVRVVLYGGVLYMMVVNLNRQAPVSATWELPTTFAAANATVTKASPRCTATATLGAGSVTINVPALGSGLLKISVL
jgi:hypothetical protein